MKSIVPVLLLIMLCSLIYSCGEEPDLTPYQGRIKRVLRSYAIEDTAVRFVDEYQYDSRKRLVKIQNSRETQVFVYNSKNQVSRKLRYYTASGTFTLIDTTFYAYQDNQLIYEIKDSEISSGVISFTKNVYDYNDGRMIRKKTYQDGRFRNMIVYEYAGGRLNKEITYEDSLEVKPYSHAIYLYDDGKLALRTERHSSGEVILSSYYFYNEHGDLSMEYAIQNQYISALLSFYNRYEYY